MDPICLSALWESTEMGTLDGASCVSDGSTLQDYMSCVRDIGSPPVTMPRYTVVMNESVFRFEDDVIDHMQDGWKLAGGIQVTVRDYQRLYYQAMYKD